MAARSVYPNVADVVRGTPPGSTGPDVQATSDSAEQTATTPRNRLVPSLRPATSMLQRVAMPHLLSLELPELTSRPGRDHGICDKAG